MWIDLVCFVWTFGLILILICTMDDLINNAILSRHQVNMRIFMGLVYQTSPQLVELIAVLNEIRKKSKVVGGPNRSSFIFGNSCHLLWFMLFIVYLLSIIVLIGNHSKLIWWAKIDLTTINPNSILGIIGLFWSNFTGKTVKGTKTKNNNFRTDLWPLPNVLNVAVFGKNQFWVWTEFDHESFEMYEMKIVVRYKNSLGGPSKPQLSLRIVDILWFCLFNNSVILILII